MRSLLRHALLAVVAVASAFAAGCGLTGGDNGPEPAPSGTTRPAALAPTSPPAPTATPAPTLTPTPATPTTYIVEAGDNPTLIANKLGVPEDEAEAWIAEMLALNGTAATFLQVGQELILPPIAGTAVAVASPTTATPDATSANAATATAISSATPAPSATAAPGGFGDGIRTVGVDVLPGTYRTREPAALCYWARLSGFGNGDDDIISDSIDENGFSVVTILPTDAGFESDGCGQWSPDLSPVTQRPQAPFSDGTYIVGTDIAPGTWTTSDATDTCYWERTSGFGASLGEVVDSGIEGPTVTIAPTDAGFYTAGCGTWTYVP